jgi:hypothetical protein
MVFQDGLTVSGGNMRKTPVWSLLLFFLLPALAVADPVGFGLSGGFLIPVAQEDQGSGALFGVKICARMGGKFTIEPNIHFGSYGSSEITGAGSREGSSLKHYGLDIVWGNPVATPGFKPYLFLGGGLYNTKRDGDVTTNKSGWSFGGGFAVGVRPDLDIDLRGRFSIASADQSTSKKSVGITAGLIYYVGRR